MLSLSSEAPYIADMPIAPRAMGNTFGPTCPSCRNKGVACTVVMTISFDRMVGSLLTNGK